LANIVARQKPIGAKTTKLSRRGELGAWIVGLVAGRSMWCASRFAFELLADVILGGLDGVQMRHQDWNPANERLAS